MTRRDLYEVLGVPRSADAKAIRKAYRDLARKYHPDRNPNNKQAEESFKEASYASEILSDSEKRKLYDEFGEIGLREGFNADAYRAYSQQRAAGAGSRRGGFGSLEDLFGQAQRGQGGFSGSLEDLFGGQVAETIFGRQGGRGRSAKRESVSEVTIPFADAVKGTEREFTIDAPGEAARTIKVRIPPGVKDGGRVRLRGHGPGGGDIVLQIQVEAHPWFKREGHDLLLDLPVTVGEAFHGAKIQVPTPAGSVSVTIPKGVRGGAKLRLRGKGVPHGSEVGDLIVQIHIVLPKGEGAAEAIDRLEAGYAEPVRGDLSF